MASRSPSFRQAAEDALKRLADSTNAAEDGGVEEASTGERQTPRSERRWTAPEGYVPKRKKQEKAEKAEEEAPREAQQEGEEMAVDELEGVRSKGLEQEQRVELEVKGSSDLSTEISPQEQAPLRDEGTMQHAARETKANEQEREREREREAQAALSKLKKDAEEAEKAARASRGRAQEMQEGIGRIKRSFAGTAS